MCLECQNKYLSYGPKSRLIRTLLYAYTNKIVYDEILPSQTVVYFVRGLPGPYSGSYYYGLPLGQSDQRIRSVFQSVYNKIKYLFNNQLWDMEFIEHLGNILTSVWDKSPYPMAGRWMSYTIMIISRLTEHARSYLSTYPLVVLKAGANEKTLLQKDFE